MGRSPVTIIRLGVLWVMVRNPATELSQEVLQATGPHLVRPRGTVLSPARVPEEACRPIREVSWAACR